MEAEIYCRAGGLKASPYTVKYRGPYIRRLERSRDEVKKTSLELEKSMARTDPLTGMINRRYFTELAEKEILRAKRFKGQ